VQPPSGAIHVLPSGLTFATNYCTNTAGVSFLCLRLPGPCSPYRRRRSHAPGMELHSISERQPRHGRAPRARDRRGEEDDRGQCRVASFGGLRRGAWRCARPHGRCWRISQSNFDRGRRNPDLRRRQLRPAGARRCGGKAEEFGGLPVVFVACGYHDGVDGRGMRLDVRQQRLRPAWPRRQDTQAPVYAG
jgi:hypothetical protein